MLIFLFPECSPKGQACSPSPGPSGLSPRSSLLPSTATSTLVSILIPRDCAKGEGSLAEG